MSGVPRKIQSVRTTLNEQIAKLQLKHNTEVEFLDDIRCFTKSRSELEKEYGKKLQQLVQQYAGRREVRPPPDLEGFDRGDHRGLMEVWKMLLQKTEDMAKSRTSVSELLLNQISDIMRQQRRGKEQNFRKCIDIAQRMSQEVQESIKELTTTKKTYIEEEKVCAKARERYTEADERLRRKDRRIFTSKETIERNHKKFSERLKMCQKRMTVSRNDYLLSLATTNAHLDRHSTGDFPKLMARMDRELYERARHVYTLYAQIEVDAANMIRADFEDLREQANLVSRDYVVACFIERNPVVRGPAAYHFEPMGKDLVRAVSRDHGAEIFLDRDARKWAGKIIEKNAAIADKQKAVQGVRSVTEAYTKNPEFGTLEAFNEAQQQMELMQEEIRQLEVHTTKAEARLEALREADVDVSRWLQGAGEQDCLRTTDLLSVGERHHSSSLSINSCPDSEWADTASQNSNQGGRDQDGLSIDSDIPPKYCTALYTYQAQRGDELHLEPDEELSVIEWDDGDGWCRGKNKGGKEGYFPQNYVQPSSRSSTPPSLTNPLTQNGEKDRHQANGTATLPATLLRAVYDYTAQFDEELSFPEGAIIELTKTDDNGVDDGWWQGTYAGKSGVFPSVVVEPISNGVDPPPFTLGLADINSTLTESRLLPPPDSPPPLPPNYPPPPISPEDLGVASLGPSAVSVPAVSPKTSPIRFSPFRLRNTSSPMSRAPTLTLERPSPDPVVSTFEESRTWRMDSFDDIDGDDSFI